MDFFKLNNDDVDDANSFPYFYLGVPYPILINSDPVGEFPYIYTVTWVRPETGGLSIKEYEFRIRQVIFFEDSFDKFTLKFFWNSDIKFVFNWLAINLWSCFNWNPGRTNCKFEPVFAKIIQGNDRVRTYSIWLQDRLFDGRIFIIYVEYQLKYHHHHQLNVHFLPKLIKGMNGCLPTALGRQL